MPVILVHVPSTESPYSLLSAVKFLKNHICPECHKLWQEYTRATTEHIRLDSKLRLAALSYDHEVMQGLTRANSMTEGEPKPSQRTPSYLNIKLKSSEEIRLQGDEADEVWAAYQKANRRPTR